MDFRNSYQNTEPYSDYRIKDTIEGLSKLSDAELMKEFSKQVAAKKQSGGTADIDKVIKTITPFLNAEQKARLDMIVKSIKE